MTTSTVNQLSVQSQSNKNTDQKVIDINNANLVFDENTVMPKEQVDFLTQLIDNKKMEQELLDLVKDDLTWKKFIFASITDNQMDNWELLSELEF